MIGLTAAVYFCFQLSLWLAGSLSVRRKIIVDVFYSTFTDVFYFCHVFMFLTFFCFCGNAFSSVFLSVHQVMNEYFSNCFERLSPAWQFTSLNSGDWQFLHINVSQVSVVMRLRCARIFNYHFTSNSLLRLTVKEF